MYIVDYGSDVEASAVKELGMSGRTLGVQMGIPRYGCLCLKEHF